MWSVEKDLVPLNNSFASCISALVSTMHMGCILSGTLQNYYSVGPSRPIWWVSLHR